LTHEFRRSPHAPKIPLFGFVPCSEFLTLFTVYSSLGPVGLFHPTNAFRLLPSGVLPLVRRGRTRRVSLTAVVIRVAHSAWCKYDRQNRSPCPNCVTTKTDFAVLPRPRVRTTTVSVTRPHRPLPSWASSSPGLFLRCDAGAHHLCSSRALRSSLLGPVARTVQRPAAPRSVTRLGGTRPFSGSSSLVRFPAT